MDDKTREQIVTATEIYVAFYDEWEEYLDYNGFDSTVGEEMEEAMLKMYQSLLPLLANKE